MKKILIFGSYPIEDAQHGGQKRVEAIVKTYKTNGFLVRYVGVYDRSFYPKTGKHDIALHIDRKFNLTSALTSDMSVGKLIYSDLKVRGRVKLLINEFDPDIIEIEQVFPYFGLAEVLRELRWKKPLIYNSQNIEYDLKDKILKGAGVNNEERKAIIDDIFSLERELVRVSNLVITCTKSDSEKYQSWGAKNIVCAPNGTSELIRNSKLSEKLKNEYTGEGINKLILFIGSAHPPNETGFMDMIGSKIGFLKPDTRILLIGGVSELIRQRFSVDYRQYCVPLRVEFVGRVSEEKLAAFINIADMIILPIVEGGGSNIKTAEALMSGKKIVATPIAMRSFEEFKQYPNVLIAKDGVQFRDSISLLLRSPKLQLSNTEISKLDSLKWESTLLPIVGALKEL